MISNTNQIGKEVFVMDQIYDNTNLESVQLKNSNCIREYFKTLLLSSC